MRIAWTTSTFAAADPRPLQLLEQPGIEVIPNPFGRRLTEQEAIDHLQGVDGLIAGVEPLTRAVFESATSLKAVARVGIGMDSVDVDAARDCGVAVSNTPDPPARSVAELAVTAALALTRGLVSASHDLHEGNWNKVISNGLRGTTVLIVGFGRIGRAVADMLRPFGPLCLASDPAFTGGHDWVEPVDFDDGLARADVVTLHAGGKTELIGAEQLNAMKDGAFLLNAARGGMINETALAAALDSGKLAGAWLDVFADEPYTGPLQSYPQVLMTPHAGTYTRACRLEMETEAVHNLLRDLGVTPTS